MGSEHARGAASELAHSLAALSMASGSLPVCRSALEFVRSKPQLLEDLMRES